MLVLQLLPSVVSPNGLHRSNYYSILLFRIEQQHTHMHTSIHSYALTRTYTHTFTSTWAENTDRQKKKKLTPYVRFQSACRPSLREASDDRMIIAVRLFVCYLYIHTHTLSLSAIPFIRSFVRSFVRPHSTTNGRNTGIACFLVCTYACTCLCL